MLLHGNSVWYLPFKGGEADTLANRLAEAEKALALKQEHIDKLKEEMEQLRAKLETIPVLNHQVKITCYIQITHLFFF